MKHILAGQAFALALVVTSTASAGEPTETLTLPTFGKVALYAPKGAPDQVVLFVSGDGGWNLGVVSMAERIRDLGALVVGIDIRAFLNSLEASKACAYPAGALEELSRAVQLHRKLPEYKRPILVGYSSGATLVYAALVAAPPETFAGAISLGFCPDLEIHNPPCRQRGLVFEKKVKGVGYDLGPFPRLAVPWLVLQGETDQVCDPKTTGAFVAATGAARLFSLPKVGHGFSVPRNWEPQFVESYQAIAGAHAPEPAVHGSRTGVEDLGLVEVLASGGQDPGAMAVILTGDGGWADIDKSVAAGLAAAGVPVVGWSSLRYYWTPRTPEAAAKDLSRIVEYYAAAWRKQRVLLVGYSFGADVLPFLVNRLEAPALARVSSVILLGLSGTAAFEFHLSSWLGGGGDTQRPTAPEVARLPVPVTCVHGTDERDSGCLGLSGPRVRVVPLGSGHHFGGSYGRVVELILGPAAAH
ncbi:MAG: AcvB/VirJ family lysyl-phosphatidylglycerol hydrolase [Vicinamibacterales bacterium]